MARSDSQRRHYEELVRTRRPTRYLLSCGFADRFDPALLERRPRLRRSLERLAELLVPDRAGRVLDLGCGTAYYWPILSRRASFLAGVDLTPAMAREGQRYQVASGSIGPLLAADAAGLPFADRSFDAVVAIDVMHHAAPLERVVREVHRILEPGGTFAVVEPNVLNPVVLAAHLFPPEERGALWPNNLLALSGALRRSFGSVEALPATYVSGLEADIALRIADLLEPLLARPPFSLIALRRVLVARRGA